jgi:mycothiol synthase
MCAVNQSRTIVPLPPGYSTRAAEEADAEAIYRLIHDYDVSIVGYSDFAPDDLLELFREDHFDIDRDSCLVLDGEGRPAGFTMIWAREPHRRYSAYAVVHPQHRGRGIGTGLLGFLERRMRAQVADHEGATLWNWIDLEDEAARRIVEAAGFSEVRRHYTMIGDLSALDPAMPAPEWISIRTCNEDDAEVIHSLDQETFAEHWGFTPRSYEQWHKQSYERSDTDLSMWFLALVDGEPVGFLIGRAMEGIGWIGDLGVRKTHRRRGVASALLRHSLSDFKRRGFPKVGLGVDASNETRAVHLYEKLGMQAERVYVTYEKAYGR